MKRVLLALVLIFIITGAVLSVATVYVPEIVEAGMIRQNALGGLIIRADELPEKPQNYFTIDNPDSYVLQAISNPSEIVFVGNWANTQIDEEIDEHGGIHVANIEINEHYYAIALGSVTPSPPEELVLIPTLNAGYILWVTSLIATVIILLFTKRSKKAAV